MKWLRKLWPFGRSKPPRPFEENDRTRDRVILVEGRVGPRLAEVPEGTFFAVMGHENYPKIMTSTGYYDLTFQVKHANPDPNWPTVIYTEAQVREIFRKKRPDLSEDQITQLLTQRRIVVADGEL
jgi:hypothetical protein